MSSEFFRKYLDIIVEADSGPADIGQIAASLKFLPTTKLARKYQFVANGVPGRMPAMTYTVAAQEQPVVTVTSDGKETQNVAAVNDIIMSGPSQENYVVKAAKFPKLYQGAVGKTVIPEQSPRMVALYRGPQAVTFTAPWGESMVLKPGDYLVKDGDAGYYRIARVEFEQTYNEPKQSVAEAIPTIRGTPKAQPSADYTGEDLVRDANALFTAGGFKLADKEVEPRVDNPKKINTTYYWRKKIKGLTPAQGQVQQLMIEIYNYAPKRTYWAINDWANDGARVTPELAQKLWSLMERTIKDSIDTAERENYWYSMIGNGKKPKGLEEEGMTEQELDELNRRDFLRGAGAALGGAALASVAGSVGARVPLKGGEVDPDYRPRPIQVKVDKFESDGAGGGVMTIGAKRYPFKQLRLSDPVPEGQRILLLPTDFGSKGMFPVIAVYSGGVIYCCDRSANESSQHKEMDETASPDALARIEELIHYKS